MQTKSSKERLLCPFCFIHGYTVHASEHAGAGPSLCKNVHLFLSTRVCAPKQKQFEYICVLVQKQTIGACVTHAPTNFQCKNGDYACISCASTTTKGALWVRARSRLLQQCMVLSHFWGSRTFWVKSLHTCIHAMH
jgi:hypothetical protein